MTISRTQGPPGGAAVVGRALSHLMTRGPDSAEAMGGATAPKATQPIPLFTLKLEDIDDAEFLKKAARVGWRYLITGEGPIAVADVTAGESGAPVFGSLIRGPMARRLQEGAELVEKRYQSVSERYEARVLEIPALYIVALWLHGRRDIFVRLMEGTASRVEIVQEDPNFIESVLALARDRRAQPIRTRGRASGKRTGRGSASG